MNRRPLMLLVAALLVLVLVWLGLTEDESNPLRSTPPPILDETDLEPTLSDRQVTRVPDGAQVLDDWQMIRCSLPVEPLAWGGGELKVGILAEPTSTDLTWVGASIQGYDLLFAVKVSEGAGVVTLPGYESASLVWLTEDEALRCLFTTVPIATPRTNLTVQVDLPEGATPDQLLVRVCDKPLSTNWDNGTQTIELEPGRCPARACVKHGTVWGCGDPLILQLAAGDQVVTLPLPDYLPAGLPFTPRYTETGIEVEALYDHYDGAQALELGDEIIAVEGRLLADLVGPERYQLTVGPVDSTLRIELLRDGQRMEVDMVRSHVFDE